MDIHNYKRQFERQIELIIESDKLSKKNKEVALKFKDYLLSEGIGLAKIGRYLLDVRKFNDLLGKPFAEANKDDMRRVVAEIEQSDLAAESKKSFKILLRKLYRFIRGVEDKGIYPDEVKWISIAIPKNHTKLPEELLTGEEIKAIIKNCDCLRDRALVATLAESGCRISEIGSMQIKHVSFEEYGARLTVNGKTGMRKILVISSAPYLQQWINEHPENDTPEAYLWFSQQTLFLSYSRIDDLIKRASKKAGIKKRVYCHLFRHSKATNLASVMTEAGMKQYFGWGQDSKMCGIYIHMNGEATDAAILRANGIEVRKETAKLLMQPIKCTRCKTVNEATNKFCKLCGLILNEEFAQETLKQD
ncbi:MAG: tyrosine-type recombinase/integrase, partial [archaeon]